MSNLGEKDVCVDSSASDLGNIKTAVPNKPAFMSFVAPKPKIAEIGKQEIDLKSLDFDDLILKIGGKTLLEYFEKVYKFLKGNEDEVAFPDIQEELEEVLVRIVKNVAVLESSEIYSSCTQICSQIMETLNSSVASKSFMLACVYRKEPRSPLLRGLGVELDNTLVYKKLYYTHLNQKFPSMSSLSCTPPLSRSTSLDSLESQRSHKLTVPSETHFKSYCLHLILDFIKNNNQLNLEFTGLSPHDAEFVYTLFSNIISGTFDRKASKDICIAIWEAVKIFTLKYEFRIRYVDSCDSTKSLILEKLYKTTGVQTQPEYRVNATDQQTEIKLPMKKSVLRYKQFVESLPPEFVDHSLQKLVNFFKDETEASVSFTMMSTDRRRFLKNILNYCRSSKFKVVYSEERRKMLDDIMMLTDNKAGYRIKVLDKKKPCKEKQLIFMKIPCFDKPAPESRPWYPLVPLEMLVRGPEADEKKKKRKKRCKENSQAVSGYRESRTAEFSRTWDLQYGLMAQKSKSPCSKDMKLPSSKNINFKSAGILNQMMKNYNSCVLQKERDPTLVEAMRKYDQDIKDLPRTSGPSVPVTQPVTQPGTGRPSRPTLVAHRNKSIRTNQLIEALSVPVKCDKAMKMMLGMGWDGGALGTRGQGITEPLMPNLGGAGFGRAANNVPSLVQTKLPPAPLPAPTLCVSNNKRSSFKFRRMFLEQLLELLTSSDDTKVVQFYPSLNKKEKGFLRHSLRTFALRSKMTIASDEQHLVEEVAEQYKKDAELVVTARVSHDKKEVVLTKAHTPILPQQRKEKRNNIKHILSEGITDNVQLLMDTCGALCQTQKSFDFTKFRLQFLMDILNFIKVDNDAIELKFATALTVKQTNFVDLCIKSINRRCKFGCTPPEVALSTEINKFRGHYRLRVNYIPNYRSVTVYKDNINNNDIRKIKASEKNELDTPKAKNCKFTETEDSTEVEKQPFPVEEDKLMVKYGKFITDAIEKAKENKARTQEKFSEEIGSDMIINNNNDLTNNKNVINDSIMSVEDSSEAENIDGSEINLDVSAMSVSDNSAYTSNLDYNETDDDDELKADKLDDKISDKDKSTTNCDTIVGLSLKPRIMSDIIVEKEPQNIEKPEANVKIVYLTKTFFLTKDMPKYIQGLISLNISQTKELPLLKCHGIQNGALVYSCHTRKSYDWLQNICVANNINMVEKEFDKMSLKINYFFDFDDDYFFDMLALYNKGISTKDWSVLKKDVHDDCVIYQVKMDRESFKFVVDSDLALYAGVDKVTFSIIWE